MRLSSLLTDHVTSYLDRDCSLAYPRRKVWVQCVPTKTDQHTKTMAASAQTKDPTTKTSSTPHKNSPPAPPPDLTPLPPGSQPPHLQPPRPTPILNTSNSRSKHKSRRRDHPKRPPCRSCTSRRPRRRQRSLGSRRLLLRSPPPPVLYPRFSLAGRRRLLTTPLPPRPHLGLGLGRPLLRGGPRLRLGRRRRRGRRSGRAGAAPVRRAGRGKRWIIVWELRMILWGL
jgi:hypothetical protein